jgi:hypothetical protein
MMLDQDLSIEVLNKCGLEPSDQAMGSPAPRGMNKPVVPLATGDSEWLPIHKSSQDCGPSAAGRLQKTTARAPTFVAAEK